MPDYVLGVDGCKGGWLACRCEIASPGLTFEVHPTFAELLRVHSDAQYIAVDLPIGMKDNGQARRCDVEARQSLRAPRASSVFPAPARCLLSERTYSDANARCRQVCGKGLTKQAFGIFPKIAEVDALMTPETQKRVFEVHPELCFWSFNGVAMQHGKTKAEGFKERRDVLIAATELAVPERDYIRRLGLAGKPDDFLDATVAAVTARRMAAGDARRLPLVVEFDDRRLRMEMVY